MDHQSERSLVAAAARALRKAGYPLVLEQVALGRVLCDVVAYAADRQGELQPVVAVEVKRKLTPVSRLHALEQLAAVRHEAGTRQHYLFDGQQWWLADGGLSKLTESGAPLPSEDDRTPLVTDRRLIESLILRELAERTAGRTAASDQLQAVLSHFAASGELAVEGQRLAVPASLRWAAARQVTYRVLTSEHRFESSTHPAVGDLAAQLVSGQAHTYLDPFCGTASLLWTVLERTAERLLPAQLVGIEVNQAVAAVARALASSAPGNVEIVTGNAFQLLDRADSAAAEDNRASLTRVDAVVSQPPLGLRLPTPHELSTGEVTTDGDLAALDLCVRALRPGGRAVLQTARSWTFKSGQAQRYRTHLAARHHVAALVGLPAGAVLGASIPSLLVVIDKSSPGPTFVAQLDHDWQEQLKPDGAAREHLLEHLGSDE